MNILHRHNMNRNTQIKVTFLYLKVDQICRLTLPRLMASSKQKWALH